MRTDLKAAAVGAKMLDAKIADGVAVSPFLRATVADGRPGVLVGAEVRAWIQDGAELTASVAYRHGDLLTSAEGATDGVTAHVGVAIRF